MRLRGCSHSGVRSLGMGASKVTAVVTVVVFGVLSYAFGRTAMQDWRAARAEHDRGLMLYALETFWAAILPGAVAVAAAVWFFIG